MCIILVVFLQIEVHRTESLDPGPSCLEVENTIAKFKKYKSPHSEKIQA
jgi:hypothetical protein